MRVVVPEIDVTWEILRGFTWSAQFLYLSEEDLTHVYLMCVKMRCCLPAQDIRTEEQIPLSAFENSVENSRSLGQRFRSDDMLVCKIGKLYFKICQVHFYSDACWAQLSLKVPTSWYKSTLLMSSL